MAKDLKIRIIGDASKLGAAFDDAEGKMAGFGGRVSGMAGKITAALGAAFAGGVLVDWGSQLFALGGQLEVFDRKAGTVFEGQADSVRSWADASNEAMGLSDEALVGLAANFGDLLKPMGFTADQAAKMSTEVVGLSGALSAWSGGQVSSADASDILAKAMLGERDGLKSLGIAISEADVSARLAAKGQSDLTGAALEQAKAIATQELIFEKSTDAQKAWADGSMKGVQSTNELKAKFEDLKATLAEKLLPVGQKLVGWVVDDMIPMFGTASKFVGEHQEILVGLGAVIVAALVPAFTAWASAAIPAAAATLAAAAPVIAVAAAIGLLAAGLMWAWKNVDWFREGITSAAKHLGTIVGPALDGIADLWHRTWDGVRSAWDSVAQPAFDLALAAFVSISSWWDTNGPALIAKVEPVFAKVGQIFASAGELIGTVMGHIGTVVGVVLGVVQGLWENYGDLILDGVKVVWDTIWGVISGVLDAIQGVIDVVMGVITGDWSRAWDGIKGVLSGAWSAISAIVTGAIGGVWNTVQMVGRAIGDTLSGVWDGIKDAAGSAWSWIKDTVSSGVSGVWDAISSLPGKILGIIGSIGSAARSIGSTIMDKIGDGLGAVGGAIAEVGSKIWASIKNFINSNFIDKIRNFSVSALGVTLTPFTGLPRLAEGGIATGPMLAMIGDNRSGKEAVVPLERAHEFGFGGGGGAPVSITIQTGVGDPVAIGRALIEALDAAGRHGAKINAQMVA